MTHLLQHLCTGKQLLGNKGSVTSDYFLEVSKTLHLLILFY